MPRGSNILKIEPGSPRTRHLKNQLTVDTIMENSFSKTRRAFCKIRGSKRGALLRTTVLGLMLASAASSITHAQVQDQPIGARVYFDYLHAKHITTEAGSGRLRDEVKIRVIGRGPNGLPIDHTLPSTNLVDDYLQFWTGTVASASKPGSWTNQQGHVVPVPVIYEGILPKNGDRADFLVLVQEQDNATLGQVKEAVNVIFGGCEKIAGAVGVVSPDAKKLSEACKFAKEAAGFLPGSDPHELIGAFYVQIKNVDGVMQTTSIAANGEVTGSEDAKTVLVGLSEDAIGLVARDGAMVNDRFELEMSASDGVGKYGAGIKSEQHKVQDVVQGLYQLNTKDVERGTCRRAKPVALRLRNGSFEDIARGVTNYYRGDEIAGVNYRCDRDFNREGYIFDRRYSAFAVQRTLSKLNFYPFDLKTFTNYSVPGQGTARSRIHPDFSLAPGDQRAELRLESGQDLTMMTCEQIRQHDWSAEAIRPVVNWWSGSRGDNAAMIDPRWIGCPGDGRAPGYGFHRIDGFAFSPDRPQPDGTVPLTHWWNPTDRDNMLTAHPAFVRAAQKGPGTRLGQFVFVKTAGYILEPTTTKTLNLVPFNTWWNAREREAHSTSHPQWRAPQGAVLGNYRNIHFDGYLISAKKVQ